jgi:hypothetical protein
VQLAGSWRVLEQGAAGSWPHAGRGPTGCQSRLLEVQCRLKTRLTIAVPSLSPGFQNLQVLSWRRCPATSACLTWPWITCMARWVGEPEGGLNWMRGRHGTGGVCGGGLCWLPLLTWPCTALSTIGPVAAC